MNINRVVESVNYIEFINKINSLANNLLYNPDSGYFNLKAKEAVFGIKDIILKFDYEVSKIRKDANFENIDELVKEKRNAFFENLLKHQKNQIAYWADDVFDEFVENLLLEVSINKQNYKKEYKDLIEAINWYSKIKNLDKDNVEKIYNEINKKFKNALNSNDSDYIPQVNVQKSSFEDFFELWNLFLEKEEEFLALDLTSKANKLIQSDLNYFLNLQNKNQTYKKTSVRDEVFLINYSVNLLKIKNDEEKYFFIKDVLNDFLEFIEKNKQINEEDKIQIIKRRIELFKDRKNETSNYYEKLFF